MSSTSRPEPAPPRAGRPWSLAARLTAWYAGSAFLLILAATGYLYAVLAANLDREDDEFLADKVHILRVLLRERADDPRALRQELEWESAASQYAPFSMRVLDDAGRVVLETPGMGQSLPPDAFPSAAEDDGGPAAGKDLAAADGKAYRVLAARAVGPGGAASVLQVALERSHEEDLLAGYRRSLWLVLGVALLACAIAGHQIARRGLRPLKDVTRTAAHIRSSTLHERLAPGRLPAELAALAGTFNDMLDRLEESFGRLARFSADIAHELRTPVNNLRGEAEVALRQPRTPEEYREVLGSSLEECARLAGLIDSLLFLARADSPASQVAREPTDVGRELAAVGEFYEAAAAEAGVKLTVACPEAIVAALDRTLFQRAVGNLVANALAHTGPGGQVTLKAEAADGAVAVEVVDTGCGIPPEHVPHVFDRFYRVDRARSNAGGRVGLGLAIVRSIVTLHGGTATIASEVGKGTRVRLVFPRVFKT